MTTTLMLLLSLLIISILNIVSSSDDLNNILENVNMNAVKQRFQPNDLNALVNNMNNPYINIDDIKDVKSPNWSV